jgi:hypothetical protein
MFFYTSCLETVSLEELSIVFSLDGLIYVANSILGGLAVRSVKEHCCWVGGWKNWAY